MSDSRKNKGQGGLMKSLSFIEKSAPTKGEESPHKTSHKYDFLATLRKVKKLSTENIQSIYKNYNISNIPTSLFNYGLRLSRFMKQEETALVLEVIRSFKEFLENTELSANEDASRALRTKVEFFKKVTSEFVETTEAMENWFKYINSIIVCLPARVDWPDARAWILKMVDKFIMDKIIDAEAFIIEFTSNMVQDNETILIYGYSTLMHSLIVNIHEKKHNVSIIYANEVENKTGQEFVAKLASKGVQITYTTLNGVPFFMNKVSKIMVCGFTMFSNGSMLGTAGTALIAAYGSNFRKPFYVLCESFKFSEKSKIDGLIVNKGVESVIEDKPGTFNRISLTYDLTPQKFISLVVSEIGAMPPSSVSVILREFYSYDTSNIKYVPPSSN